MSVQFWKLVGPKFGGADPPKDLPEVFPELPGGGGVQTSLGKLRE